MDDNVIKDIPIELINQVEKTETAENLTMQDDELQEDNKDELENNKNEETDNEGNFIFLIF